MDVRAGSLARARSRSWGPHARLAAERERPAQLVLRRGLRRFVEAPPPPPPPRVPAAAAVPHPAHQPPWHLAGT